ncbi:MAG: hypothetical protein ACAH09_05620 [Methylophilaceae bacterium]|uniref:hypothetical protein n=1 Tax=Methylobacillus sp. MM3 TaxID=1848039 RepID=UPI001041F34E|nr:hypothetical protein [Methylobacillus sp. MM3]
MIRITHNLDKLVKHLNAIEKQIPFAAAKTLTVIGKQAKSQLGSDIRDVFERPTPYIANSPFSTVATKAKPETIVGIRDQASRGASPAQYIKEHFGGGIRGSKPFEMLLGGMGVLPAGWKAVPAAGLKLDAFGNPSRAQLKEILGALRTGLRVASGRGKRQSLQGYFVVLPGKTHRLSAHLSPGIWRRIERSGRSVIIPVFIFVSNANYRDSINLRKIAANVIERDFNAVFAREMVNALGTAKG